MQNEPVIVQSIITAICAALAPVFVKYGIDQNAVAGAVGALASAAVGTWSVVRARKKVTPLPNIPKAVPPTKGTSGA